MADHTKEPWSFYDDTHDGKTNRIEIVAAGKTIARIYQSVQAEDLPNARRIVACVNACAGLPIESLELGIFADGNLAEAVKAKVEADTLRARVAALEAKLKVAEEALSHISRLCKKQLDLISDRATGQYLDKIPVVRAINQHKHYSDAALAKIKGAS